MLLHLETHKLPVSKAFNPKLAVCSWPYEGLFAWEDISTLASPFAFLHPGSPDLKGGGFIVTPSQLLCRLCWRGAVGIPGWASQVGSGCCPHQGLLPGGAREIANLCSMRPY